MIYVCKICLYEYDESKELKKFSSLPDDWKCPICSAPKTLFSPKEIKEKNEDENVPENPNGKTSSQVIVETLLNNKLSCVFGMVGHSNLGIADAIRSYSDKIKFIGIRHEGAASFASSAYGKLTGKISACLSIAGPGATNLLTGLYDAKLDSSPVIALTGQVPTNVLGKYIFQEIDLIKLFNDVSSYQALLKKGDDFSLITHNSIKSSIEKKSVSHIVLPDDVQTIKIADRVNNFKNISIPSKKAPTDLDIEKIINALNSSNRPVIIIGNGARSCIEKIKVFAEILKCPIMTTYRAKGFIADDYKYSCGVLGLSGTNVSSHFISSCDCILAFGVGFSRHTSIPKGKRAIQIDYKEENLGRNYSVEFPILADCESALDSLISASSKLKNISSFADEIAKQWSIWRQQKYDATKDKEISIEALINIMGNLIPENAIISVDVGNIAYSLGKYFESKSQQFLLSFYLGSIGVGLPSAMGAWMATLEKDSEHFGKRVYAFVGDGGLGQYLSEWTTVAKYNMNITCIVINNNELAKISKEQKNAHFPVWETGLINPSFAEFAKSCGTKGSVVSSNEEFAHCLANDNGDSPHLIEVIIGQ